MRTTILFQLQRQGNITMVKNRMINRFISSNRGSATAFVVMASLLMSIIGLALLGIVVNASKGSSVLRFANERYFYIDNAQESILSSNDGQMVLAYSYASYYINSEIFKSTDSVEAIDDNTPSVSSNFLQFLNNAYEDEVVIFEGQAGYDDILEDFIRDARDTLYFYFLNTMLTDSSSSITVTLVSDEERTIDFTQSIQKNIDYSLILPSSDFDSYIPSDGTFTILVNATDGKYSIDSSIRIERPSVENYNGENILIRYDITKWVFSKND